MPYCVKCGTSIPETAKFCPKCGKEIFALQESERAIEIPIMNIIASSFKPSICFRNFLIVFVPMLLLSMTLLQIGPQILLFIAERLPEIEANTLNIANFILSLLSMISIAGVAIVVYLLFGVYQKGVLIHNIGNKIIEKPKPYVDSLKIGFSKYPSIFLIALLIAIFSIMLGSIRYVGWILVLIFVCIFWVPNQGIVLDNLGFIDGLKRSYHYFRKAAFSFISAYIIATMIGFFLSIIGLIPIGIVTITLILKMISVFPKTEPAQILRLIADLMSSYTLYVAVAISCIVWTFDKLYTSFGIPTKLYLEIREKAKK